ncbi:helix-turn-helix transcriptional regulator [Salibacter sp.]|uniref:helix-turn-helix domain-containing protein n=1 Tax=Salibacter sp. TaxID=2010995 RepID=UPI0028705541|nr:helix-turn-helix transcriptional regulator [Salibacter sp.]MDR9398783.1 helix-turn-helix transcriptional regulator [Salibacter sp.]MDR9487877.1 helix-turn-helix transcriptional regulator [Salibacter sp.]
MSNKSPVLLPKMQRLLAGVGENIRLARLRRKLSSEQMAERSGMGRSTYVKIEKGNPGVSIGYYLNVLNVLGLEKDFLQLAKDDVMGRKLQDANLSTKERAPKRKKNSNE